MVADALQEALVQDYDGIIRVAPAVPPGWDFDGSVYVRGNSKVDVQTRNGEVTTIVIEAGSSQSFKIRNPWPGKPVDVISAKSRKRVVTNEVGPTIEFSAAAGATYIVEDHGVARSMPHIPSVRGTPAISAKRLGPVQIGLFPNNP